jgi:hypothetical protein
MMNKQSAGAEPSPVTLTLLCQEFKAAGLGCVDGQSRALGDGRHGCVGVPSVFVCRFDLSGARVEKQAAGALPTLEIEHPVQRPRDDVGRAVAYAR